MAEHFRATCADLHKEITCSLCFETLQDPKVLSCGHVFCRSPCLESLAARSRNNIISCPQCRAATSIPGEVSDLRTAFHVNRLKDIVNRFESIQQCPPPTGPIGCVTTKPRTAERGTVNNIPVEDRCSKHPTQELGLYCLKCHQLTCRDCIVIDRKHHGHDYDSVNEVAPKYKEKMMHRLSTIEQIYKNVQQALTATERSRLNMMNDKSKLSDSIFQSFGLGEYSDTKLVARGCQKLCSGMINLMFERICVYEEKLQVVWSELDELIVSAHKNIFESSNVQFLAIMRDLLSRIQSLSGRLKGFSEIPVTLPYAASYICEHFHIFSGK